MTVVSATIHCLAVVSRIASRLVSETVSSTAEIDRRIPDDEAETRARILDATIRVLSRNGFDGLSLRAVADDAEITTATVRAYFGSRERLAAETIWRSLSLAAHSPPPARLTVAAGLDPDDTSMPLTISRMADEAADLGDNPRITALRDRLSARVRRRALTALGPDADAESVDLLERVYTDALIDAATGYSSRILELHAAQAPEQPVTGH
ncbi:TetR/AcrR family transcriptional regulator [Nocardia sp. NPDC057663]|uniref:TetR/AcrR family transcriptional regulator n=1 Tax=Nocardia sp. NPDC057663 TaxID=3346201 RepID=UPI00367151F7